MFSQFENFFKKPQESNASDGKDYSKIPQKFNINGRQIQQKKLLAEGAFGFIWLAQDINSKDEFALKRVICMTEERRVVAIKQKQIMEKLPKSPHIVKYEGGMVFSKNGKTVVVTLMELCPNGTLFDYLQKMEDKGISESTLRTIALSILTGLKIIHTSGYAHRDIKIENVLIGKDKKMKLCDFGSCTKEIIDFSQIAKKDYDLIKEEIQSYTTPMYRPPEIVDPYLKYKVDTKVDLWMTGCVLYTMAYFVHPFVQSNTVGISGAVFRFPQYPEETKYKVSDKMKDFIRNLLTPNPQYRPNCDKMLQILQRWDTLQNIPLNSDAKRIKKEHLEKEEELKKLNKKIIDIDGDIPMEQLMKIQQKLKNKESDNDQPKSFIIKKQVKKSQLTVQSSIQKKSTNKSMNSPAQPSQPKQETKKATIDELWGSSFTNTTNTAKKKESFDAFGDFFKKTDEKPLPVNNNFEQFFTETKTKPNQTSQNTSSEVEKKKQQFNLLDL